jgi:hypothetical protein
MTASSIPILALFALTTCLSACAQQQSPLQDPVIATALSWGPQMKHDIEVLTPTEKNALHATEDGIPLTADERYAVDHMTPEHRAAFLEAQSIAAGVMEMARQRDAARTQLQANEQEQRAQQQQFIQSLILTHQAGPITLAPPIPHSTTTTSCAPLPSSGGQIWCNSTQGY